MAANQQMNQFQPPNLAANEIYFISSSDPMFNAAIASGAGRAVDNGAGVIFGNVAAWITTTAREAGSAGLTSNAEMGAVFGVINTFRAFYAAFSDEERSSILTASGMTGDIYRKKMIRLWLRVNGPFGDNDQTRNFMLFIGLCSIVSNKERMMEAISEHIGNNANLAMVNTFMNNHCCTYVSNANPTTMPLVKVPSCFPDIAFSTLCMIYNEELFQNINARGDAVNAQALPANATQLQIAQNKAPWANYSNLPDFLRKPFFGNLHLSPALQEEHMMEEIVFWEKTITRSRNLDANNLPVAYLRGFQSDFYKNSVSDKFRLRFFDGTLVGGPNNDRNAPYTINEIWLCALSYLT